MIKPGVDLRGLSPIWGVAYPMIQTVFEHYGYACTITSGADSEHKPKSGRTSLHYSGLALDFRTKHMAAMDKEKVINAIRGALSNQFQILFENVGLPLEHLHIEWDIKDPEEPETEHV